MRQSTDDSPAIVIAPPARVRGGAQPLRDVLHELIESGERSIVIDLTDVPAVDTASMCAVIAAHHRLRAVGGEVVLRRPPVDVICLLDGLNRDQVMRIES